ncbi:MAG: 4Fe-4S dicluster domain-containing protein [Bacteroidales bacterium]|jgi:iron only hydrogenase large subunit-like protein|nr:4Fe-4S dicluster domain-containing protein [Bacteroidales bacterium]
MCEYGNKTGKNSSSSKVFFYHALNIDSQRCIGCSHCVKNCPTEAIRVRGGKATIYGNRCIDCGECYKVCPSGAIYVAQDDFDNIYNYKHRVVLVPSVFLGQFQEDIKASQVYSILIDVGFTHIVEVETAVPIHCLARNAYANKHRNNRPLISTFCPAIVRLIQVKFPALVNNLITTKAPVDFAAAYIRKKLLEQDNATTPEDIGLFYITPCAAKIAAVKSPVGEKKSSVDGVINMDFMYNKVYKEIKQRGKSFEAKMSANDVTSDGIMYSLTNGEKRTALCKKSYAIDEIKNVTEFLEKVEDEEVIGVDFLELRACDQGCPGGILTCGNRFLIKERITQRARQLANRERNGEIDRNKDINNEKEYLLDNMEVGKILPRSMMVLDENINVALEKLNTIREIMARLPQTDCCVCGAPSCHALAEDVACGNAQLTDCVFIQRNLEERGSMKPEESMNVMKKIWGSGKFLLLWLVMLLLSVNLFAQNVTIKGKGIGIGGKSVRLYVTADPVSNLEVEAGLCNVAIEDSLFSFKLTLSCITPLNIKIDNYQYSFLAQPGKIYDLYIHPFNYNIADSLNFYFNKFILPIEILSDSTELNKQIAIFDEAFENFVASHTTRLMNKSSRGLRDSLSVFTSRFVQDSNDTSYFATYVRYETAQLLYSLGLRNRDKMKAQLFADKPILYDNIGYMDCFNLVFENYIALGNKRMPPTTVERWLANGQYEPMIDSLGLDSVLKNEVFRELVFLKGMKDAFFTRGINWNDVIKMIDIFSTKTKFEKHKDIAKNLKISLQKVSFGLEIEDFALSNADGEKTTIRSFFKDKPTILCFMKVKDVICRRELETIHLLYNKLKDSVNIVVICFDPSLDALYNFVKNNKVGSRYTFPFMHFNFNWNMFDLFNIRDFPMFVLVDASGRIIESSLPNPSDMEGSVDETNDKYHSKWQRFVKTNKK